MRAEEIYEMLIDSDVPEEVKAEIPYNNEAEYAILKHIAKEKDWSAAPEINYNELPW